MSVAVILTPAAASLMKVVSQEGIQKYKIYDKDNDVVFYITMTESVENITPFSWSYCYF